MFKRSAALLGRAESPATRKKQKTSEGNAVQEEGRELLSSIEALAEKRTDRAIAAEFQKLPSKKLYPDYYQQIKKPIAIDVIRSNLEEGEYVTLDMLKEDLLQMCNNAKRYNQRGSMLYGDAAQIARVVKNWSGEPDDYSDESDLEEISRDVSAKNYRAMLNQTIRGILKNLREAKDRSGRLYGEIFLDLPDKKLYPDYYTTITNPMSLRTVEQRMKKNPYTKLEKFQEHMVQLWQNAFTYNDPKSQVAIDAKVLQKLTNKLIEEAKPVIQQQEKELADQAKAQAKLDARTPKPTPKAAEPSSSGGFKIKLGLRQPASTPVPTPGGRIKLNLALGNRSTSQGRDSPAGTPISRKSATPAPATPAADDSDAKVEANPPQAPRTATPSIPQSGPATPAADTRAGSEPAKTPGVPAATLAPTNVFETPVVYHNSGPPLILCLSLCASQIQPPTILHLPALPGRASLLYSWTLPIIASSMTISPSLCPSLLGAGRGYALTMSLNGRKVLASRHSGGTTPIKNSIWDLKLSAGMNCIECVVEAESKNVAGSDDAQDGAKVGGVVRDEAEASEPKQEESELEIHRAEAAKVTDGKDRERMVVMAFLR